jgi:hypothetical protein
MNVGTIIVIAFFIGFVVVVNLIRNAYVKATKGGISGAVNRALFKKDVQRGEGLINKIFHYGTTRTEAQVRTAIDARLWDGDNRFEHLFVIEDSPGFIRYAFYNNTAMRKIDRATFKADINFEPERPGFSLQFVSWLQNEDTMVDNFALGEMERMKYRIDQAAAACK